MRIKASDPQAANIAAVFVDGQRVPFPVELDTEEGWVLAAIPVVPQSVKEVKVVDPDTDNPEETSDAQWVTKKFTGKVTVLIHAPVDKEDM